MGHQKVNIGLVGPSFAYLRKIWTLNELEEVTVRKFKIYHSKHIAINNFFTASVIGLD